MSRRGQLRIVAGRWRGRRLAPAPESRPTQERVREALFSRWGERVRGARLLELFCGGGAIGFEALSRGAACCWFVDSRQPALDAVRDNAAELGIRVEMLRCDLTVSGWQRRLHQAAPFDLIYADPPYDLVDLQGVLAGAAELLAGSGELLVEHSRRRTLSAGDAGLKLEELRTYGTIVISCFRR